MSEAVTIVSELDAQTRRIVAAMAEERGISLEVFTGEMIRQAVADEAEMLAKIEEGRRQIACGDYITHDELVAQIQRWKQEQRRAA